MTTLTPARRHASRIYVQSDISHGTEYVFECFCTRIMAFGGIDSIRSGVASVPIHDNGDVSGNRTATNSCNTTVLQLLQA